MTPPNGSFNIIGVSGTLPTNLTGTLTGTATIGSTLLVVTTTPPVALDGIRTAAGLFINNTTNFPSGSRIIAQRSPVSYAVTNVSWAAGVTTLTVATMPVAPVNNMLIHIEGASNSALNGTYTASGTHSTTQIQFAQAVNPGTGFTGARVFPGIVNSVAGTGDGCRGYYTVSNASLTNVSAAAISTATRTPSLVPANTTHLLGFSNGTTIVGRIIVESVGVVAIPCGRPAAIRNLRAGSYYMSSGTTAGTDVLDFTFLTLNPTSIQ